MQQTEKFVKKKKSTLVVALYVLDLEGTKLMHAQKLGQRSFVVTFSYCVDIRLLIVGYRVFISAISANESKIARISTIGHPLV